MKASDIDTASVFSELSGQHSGHRGPYSAGGADRYYGRRYNPNFTFKGIKFREDELTEEQKAEYRKGWDEERDQYDVRPYVGEDD